MYSKQDWFWAQLMERSDVWGKSTYDGPTAKPVSFSICDQCSEIAIWFEEMMIYPPWVIGPNPNSDMPEDIKTDFEEAREIASKSPRGATALLRLAIEKLMPHLGETGNESLNEKIGNLVANGLDERIKKMLDIVRVTGNEAVHPGTMDLKDDRDTVNTLFELINRIIDDLISKPKELDSLYEKLPDGKKKGIEIRDEDIRDIINMVADEESDL